MCIRDSVDLARSEDGIEAWILVEREHREEVPNVEALSLQRGVGDHRRAALEVEARRRDHEVALALSAVQVEEVDRQRLEANLAACLLYTSDAADERSSVDLGGRRIIKKKKNVDYK